jgi:hypothetical protein
VLSVCEVTARHTSTNEEHLKEVWSRWNQEFTRLKEFTSVQEIAR